MRWRKRSPRCAPLPRSAVVRVRLRRGSRSRQAPGDGPHRGALAGRGHHHRRQPAHEDGVGDRHRHPGRASRIAAGRASSATGPPPFARRSPARSAGDVVLVAGKGHEECRSSATSGGRSATGRLVAELTGGRHDPGQPGRRGAHAGRRRWSAPTPASPASPPTAALSAGQLFVALRGPKHDGHDYLVAPRARRAAAAAIVERPADGRPAVAAVADSLSALGAMARGLAQPLRAAGHRRHRQLRQDHRQGNDGGNRASRGEVLATRGNLNNEIGLPLTLFGLDREHRAAVLELGANHAGEIARLTAICRPAVGVVTAAGPGAPGRLRQPRGRGARQGRAVRRPARRRRGRHQLRRRVRAIVARARRRAPRASASAWRPAPSSAPSSIRQSLDAAGRCWNSSS
jgi:hypothetical protein